ncbi:MAG: hypothetical protein RIC06_20970 [Cyclobacteriaceae bacterium]
MKRILFITTSNLTTNPRLLKELRVLSLENECIFIGFRLGNWSDQYEQQQLSAEHNVKTIYLSATRSPFIPWLFSTVAQYLSVLLVRIFKKSVLINAMASNKRSLLLWNYVKANVRDVDLIIAHNIGTLLPAFKLGKRLGIPFHFDVEDFYPGEGVIREAFQPEDNCEAFLMKKLLPFAHRVTFASQPIMDETRKLCPHIERPLLINNSFEKSEFVTPTEVNGKKIQLVWYSQNINHSRGLEPFIEVLKAFAEDYHLTLIGQLHQPFAGNWIEPNKHFIDVVPPQLQMDLHRSLGKYDIGLALEPGKDLNNELALSNKIWAYLQAGLYIIATDTEGQKAFIRQYEDHGMLTSIEQGDLKSCLEKIVEDREMIRKGKLRRFQLVSDAASWEAEALKLSID